MERTLSGDLARGWTCLIMPFQLGLGPLRYLLKLLVLAQTRPRLLLGDRPVSLPALRIEASRRPNLRKRPLLDRRRKQRDRDVKEQL